MALGSVQNGWRGVVFACVFAADLCGVGEKRRDLRGRREEKLQRAKVERRKVAQQARGGTSSGLVVTH